MQLGSLSLDMTGEYRTVAEASAPEKSGRARLKVPILTAGTDRIKLHCLYLQAYRGELKLIIGQEQTEQGLDSAMDECSVSSHSLRP